jgi:hypothetical protein
MVFSVKRLLPLLIVILSLTSVNDWSDFKIGSTVFIWIINTITLIYFFMCKKIYYDSKYEKNIPIITYYLFWMIVCIIRGIRVAENHWEWKHIIEASFCLLLPYLVYSFSIPVILQRIFNYWIRFALPLFLVIPLFISQDAYGLYLAPILILVLFLPAYNNIWKVILILLTLLSIFVDFSARSNVIKFSISFLLMSTYCFHQFIPNKVYKLLRIFLLLFPLVFFLLGITGNFNIFKISDYWKVGYQVETKTKTGEIISSNLSDDNRTFIYKEVLSSAMIYNYILLGRTPARGNDSTVFGNYSAEDLNTGKYERFANEVGILNIFTWTGIIGVILYSFIFFRASYLGIYRSNNTFIKLMGIFVAFRWMYSWVEDYFNFRIMSFVLWMMIAMCFSEAFRKMNDKEMINWASGIFDKKKRIK